MIWRTKLHRDPNADCWKPGNDLPVFLTGGGSNHQLHRGIVKALGSWLAQHAWNEGIRLLDLPAPTTLDLPRPLDDFGRLAVAWGLSYPPTEIGEITPISEIEDVPPLPQADIAGKYIGPEQV